MSISNNTDSMQRQNLWNMWKNASDNLDVDLQELIADPINPSAAQKITLICSHLTEKALQEQKEPDHAIPDLRAELEKLQNEQCGRLGIDKFPDQSTDYLNNSGRSVGQLSSINYQKKHPVERDQQDHRRQQPKQETLQELENAIRITRAKHEIMRLMSS